jgi:hypothetical protein
VKSKKVKKQQPAEPDPSLKWITGRQVQELYPFVRERQLRYWRDNNIVRSYTINGKPSLYVESDIHAQAKHAFRPKKRSRAQHIAKELGKIDAAVILVILALGFAFVFYEPWEKNKTYTIREFYFPFYMALFIAVVYGIGKFIMYLRRRKSPSEKK